MKVRVVLAGVVFALLAAGCLDYEETLVINKDGSGTVKMRYGLAMEYIKQMEAMSGAVAEMMAGMGDTTGGEEAGIDDIGQMFDREAIDAQLTQHPDYGLQLLEYDVKETDDARVWTITFAFRDINRLYGLYDILYPEDEGEAVEAGKGPDDMPAVFTEQPDGTWLFLRDLDEGDEAEDSEEMADYPMTYPEDEAEQGGMESETDFDDINPEELKALGMSDSMIQAMQAMQKMAQTMTEQAASKTIVFRVQFPGDIVESNATRVEGNTAIWEYSLEDFDKGKTVQRATIRR